MISRTSDDSPDRLAAARGLLTAGAVRDRAHRLLGLARADALADWVLDERALPALADTVAAVVRERYPRLDPPLHARWRHFVVEGRDLWAERATSIAWPDAAARARAEFDLAVVSVLLDAGADPRWRYRDRASGVEAFRSEGLALASLRLFEAGVFSASPTDPLRVDAAALLALDETRLANGFQVDAANPFPGLAGRLALLHRLGRVLEGESTWFPERRPGGLFDTLRASATDARLPAAEILRALLLSLGEIWTGRPTLAGVPLGDCWFHAALDTATDPAAPFVPLHKLSQWLAYSLIEPLRTAGVEVTDLDALTGLAEYRNGGLFIDGGVLCPRSPEALATTHAVADPLVVGWRALTVALLDELAPLVRERLGVDRARFPLACVLEGGTWAAGRRLAAERRPGGTPPLSIVSDGTVF